MSGCGGKEQQDKLVGTWELKGIDVYHETESGERRQASDMLMGLLQPAIGDLRYTFKEDGTFSKTSSDENVSGKYTVADDTLKLTRADGTDPEVANNQQLERRIESVSSDELVLIYRSKPADEYLVTRYIFKPAESLGEES